MRCEQKADGEAFEVAVAAIGSGMGDRDVLSGHCVQCGEVPRRAGGDQAIAVHGPPLGTSPVSEDFSGGKPAGDGVEFRVLGPLEVWDGGQRLSMGGIKQRHVLATLLLDANRVVSISRLIASVWGEDIPLTAEGQVRKMVHDLRRRLRSDRLIQTEAPGYRIVLRDEQLDVRTFELLLVRADAAMDSGLVDNAVASLTEALQLWRGEAFAGLGGPVVTSAGRRLAEKRLHVTERLIDLRMALGESRELVAELQTLVTDHPLRETLRGQLMLALYRTGRQAEALQTFAETRDALIDELGIEPGPALARLHGQILTNDAELNMSEDPGASGRGAILAGGEGLPPVRPAVIPATLPRDLPDFTGRERELAILLQVGQAGGDRTPAVVTIDGMPGVGKTALALHAAHLLADPFPDGQFFIDMHGFSELQDPMSSMEGLDQLLRMMGVSGDQIPDDLTCRSAMWRMCLAGRRVSVLLDNVNNLAQVRPLLPGAGGCAVLVTSRAMITGLDGAVRMSLDVMPEVDAVELLGRIIGERRLIDEAQEGRALVQACGYLPLAIRIAAARLNNRPQWSTQYFVDRLRQASRRLDELTADDRSVAAAIELSYDGLPKDHQRLFRCLAVTFSNSFEVYAVANLVDIPLARAETILENLLDARLLYQPRPDRYALHDLVRNYAVRASAARDDEVDRRAAIRRLLNYYLHTAAAAASRIHPGREEESVPVRAAVAGMPRLSDQMAALAWFDDEESSLLAAAEYVAAEGMDEHGSRLPRFLANFLQIRDKLHSHVDLLWNGVAAAQRLGDATLEGRNLSALSAALWQLGECVQAYQYMSNVLAIAVRTGDRQGEGVCLSRIGLLCETTGNYQEAASYLERALTIHREDGNSFEESVALISVCSVNLALGDCEAAEAAARRALTLQRALDHRVYVVSALESLASARLWMGDCESALAHLAEALDIASLIGFHTGVAAVLVRYADTYRCLGDHSDALKYANKVLDMLWTVKRPTIEVEVTNILGAIHLLRDEDEVALAQYRNAAEMAERIGYRIELAKAREGMGNLSYRASDRENACAHWEAAHALHVAMGTPGAAGLRVRLDGGDSSYC